MTDPRPAWATRDGGRSAVLVGSAWFGPGAGLAQGAVLRANHAAAARFGAGTTLLENGVAIGATGLTVGRATFFGHRSVIVDATIGNHCEIGNASILLPGARLGDRCFLGEGTLIPPGATFAGDSVIVGRPGRRIRTANADDLARLTMLRGGSLALPPDEHVPHTNRPLAGATMGQIYAYRGIVPQIDPTAVVFDTAEITGDVHVGPGTVVGSGVRIIGDSHGPVRIGANVQILENTVLHLLPDNELIVEDDVTIGPGCMIHGCHLGTGSVVEPGAQVCDGVIVGAGAVIAAGSLMPQRSTVEARTVVEGFPARPARTLDDMPARPAWAIPLDALASITRVG